MSTTRTCDLCGREITDRQPYVTVQVFGSETSDGRWNDGWLTHLHTEGVFRRDENCFERVDELVHMMQEQAEHIGAIPVASQRQIQRLRDLHHNPGRDAAAESLRALGLTPRAQTALVRRGIDLAAAGAMTDEELLAVDGVGHGAVGLLRAATEKVPDVSEATREAGR